MKEIKSCFPGCISGVHRFYKGFTLIEILVVVLIIALLAAVALPQYQKSVIKSRFSSVIPPTKTIADAQEFYYLNNGEYAEEPEDLDVTPQQNSKTGIILSDKKNYKYVMGIHEDYPQASYVVYQKHSKRFAGNIHCEAEKDDALANWLCETGLGGTLITGAISGNDYSTYLLSGDAGTDKFLREDCAEGYYDNNGTCTQALGGYYAEDGERKTCPPGTYSTRGATSCELCPAGQYAAAPANSFCYSCATEGYYSAEGAIRCEKCPDGQTNNEDHTSCVPM